MKLQSMIVFALTTTTCVLTLSESTALARLPTTCRATLTAPASCTGRDLNGYFAGVGQGVSTVDTIWESPTVDQNPDNWEVVVARVTTSIPATVATVYSPSWTQYLQCRTQGLLEGAVCRMNELDPIPGCQLDGADWGRMSASIYCMLSIELDGLGDVPPWFTRYPTGMCGDGFQTYCEDVYRYGATEGSDPLDAAVLALLTDRGVDPANLLQPGCLSYTVPPWDLSFEDSVYVDCAYNIP